MIRIYYKDRLISITKDKLESDKSGFQAIAFNQLTDPKVSIKQFLANKNVEQLNIYGAEENRGLAILKAKLKHILAAGGIVENPDGLKLFIFRNGKWDIPKGKAEKGETAEICALREVSEECGINTEELTIKHPIGNTYHIYKQSGEIILKTTAWFKMNFSGDINSVKPQLEEDIEKCAWVSNESIPILMKNTYSSIKRFIKTHAV